MRMFLVPALLPAAASAVLCAALSALPTQAHAQAPSATVVVTDAWVRPAAKGQRVTGGYLQIKAQESLTLLGAASPVAGRSELHEMKMDGDVMRMRALPGLAIAAGQTVSLQPGGNHLMLLDLKRPIAVGAKVPLTLKFRDARGQTFDRAVMAEARSSAPSGAPASGAAGQEAGAHGHHGDHHDHH